MKALALKRWHAICDSYWIVPALMAVAAIVLSFVTVAIDQRVGADWLATAPWLYANQPSGARALLSTIAGSMITVAGVTFSITVATVAQATSHFGPRLLTNFMNDRGNQVTLGTFITTFLYCVLVLRTVHGADGSAAADFFVPHISIACAVLLSVASLGVLIYFIHHIAESIHISNLVARTGRHLMRRLDERFPGGVGEELTAASGHQDTSDEALARLFQDAFPVRARGDGYIQQLDGHGLIEIARRYDLVLWIRAQPGSYVNSNTTLVLVRRPAPDRKVAAKIRRCFAWGSKRTPAQDVMFLCDQLVEIAAKALSPGINDPFTAIHCISWLGSALGTVASRRPPSAGRYDRRGVLRVIAPGQGFEQFADRVFDQLRPYVQRDRNAALHMMTVSAELSCRAETVSDRIAVLRHAEVLRLGCRSSALQKRDLEMIERQFAIIQRMANGGAAVHRRRADAAAE